MLEPDPLPSYLFFYWLAFWDLDTDRNDAEGAVPFTAILRYCRAFDIVQEDAVDETVAYIRALDRSYQRLRSEELKAQTEDKTKGAQGTPAPNNPTGRGQWPKPMRQSESA